MYSDRGRSIPSPTVSEVLFLHDERERQSRHFPTSASVGSRIHSIRKVPSVHGSSRIYFEHHVYSVSLCLCWAFILGPSFIKVGRNENVTRRKKSGAVYFVSISIRVIIFIFMILYANNHSQKRGVILGRFS